MRKMKWHYQLILLLLFIWDPHSVWAMDKPYDDLMQKVSLSAEQVDTYTNHTLTSIKWMQGDKTIVKRDDLLVEVIYGKDELEIQEAASQLTSQLNDQVHHSISRLLDRPTWRYQFQEDDQPVSVSQVAVAVQPNYRQLIEVLRALASEGNVMLTEDVTAYHLCLTHPTLLKQMELVKLLKLQSLANLKFETLVLTMDIDKQTNHLKQVRLVGQTAADAQAATVVNLDLYMSFYLLNQTQITIMMQE